MPAKKITTVEIAAMRSEFHKGYQSISDLRFSGVWEIQAISTPPQMRRSSVLPTGKTLARTEFTSDRAFQIRAPVGRQPNGTSAAMRSEFHKGYQSISDLRFSGVWEIQAISTPPQMRRKKFATRQAGFPPVAAESLCRILRQETGQKEISLPKEISKSVADFAPRTAQIILKFFAATCAWQKIPLTQRASKAAHRSERPRRRA